MEMLAVRARLRHSCFSWLARSATSCIINSCQDGHRQTVPWFRGLIHSPMVGYDAALISTRPETPYQDQVCEIYMRLWE